MDSQPMGNHENFFKMSNKHLQLLAYLYTSYSSLHDVAAASTKIWYLIIRTTDA